MESKHLQNLIDKLLAGKATAEEKEMINESYRNGQKENVLWTSENRNEEKIVKTRMLSKIHGHVGIENKRHSSFFSGRSLKVAAVIGGIILLSGLLLRNLYPSLSDESFASQTIEAPAQLVSNRFIMLPDSSTVLLRPGSSLSYNFNEKLRRVSFSGEAYFDIKHLSKRPFVIHTRNIVTTVLGTAFNIKAYDGQNVEVSVTRGKVSVLDENTKKLATLTPNQQLLYSNSEKNTVKKPIEASSVTEWIRSDMKFEDLLLEDLATKLEDRYNVKINIHNPALKKCSISGGFTGTEPLDQVLQVVCNTMGLNYKIDKNTVTIDGKECQ